MAADEATGDGQVSTPSYLVLRARHAATAPACYQCFETKVATVLPERSTLPVAVMGPPLILSAAALMNPEAARATIGATIGAVLSSAPVRPSISVATTLFPDVVPAYDQEAGLALPSAPVPATVAAGRGVRVGSFLIEPAVTAGTLYDSNVLGVRGSPGSPILDIAPSVAVTGEWSRGRVGAFLGVDNATYTDVRNQSRTDLTAALGGTIAVGRGEATIGVSHLSLHDDPAAIGSIPSSTPTPFQVNDLRASLRFVIGRLSLQPFVDGSHWTYGSATVLGTRRDQTFRDRLVMQAGGAARFNVSERRDLLASLSFTRTTYDHFSRAGAGPAPDSNGALLLGGVDWELTGGLKLRALAGVQARAFTSGQYRSRVVPVGQISAIWTPQRMTTVSLTAARSLEDLAQEDTGGTIFSRAELAVGHEIQRDLMLRGRVGVGSAEFLLRGGTQASVYGGAGFEWAFSRSWKLVGDAEVRRVSAPLGQSGAASGPYTRIQTGLRLTTAL